jgi:hypothetical protein
VDADRVLAALIGALFGAGGWLLVGMFINRTQSARVAKNAARAVWFELTFNRIAVGVAAEHGAFESLSRSAYERLLPELATWLRAEELLTISRAYLGHAGYDQLRRDEALPVAARKAVLAALSDAHDTAVSILGRRAFSTAEIERMRSIGGDTAMLVASIDPPGPSRRDRGRGRQGLRDA